MIGRMIVIDLGVWLMILIGLIDPRVTSGRFWLAQSAAPMDDGFNDDVALIPAYRAHN
jgi:hypothetical protein